jgi:hypothetical protein
VRDLVGGAARGKGHHFASSAEAWGIAQTWHDPRIGEEPEDATMGRALEAVRTRELDELFGYFGLDEVVPELVRAHREAIAERFDAEVQEIRRLCTRLREKERFTIVREALRLAYESSIPRGVLAPSLASAPRAR